MLEVVGTATTANATGGVPGSEAAVVVADLPVDAALRKDTPREATRRALTLRAGKGYAYREANWQIGRAAERADVQVKKFVPGDRWAAWRKSNARIEANAERKRLKNAGKKAPKPKARKPRVVRA